MCPVQPSFCPELDHVFQDPSQALYSCGFLCWWLCQLLAMLAKMQNSSLRHSTACQVLTSLEKSLPRSRFHHGIEQCKCGKRVILPRTETPPWRTWPSGQPGDENDDIGPGFLVQLDLKVALLTEINLGLQDLLASLMLPGRMEGLIAKEKQKCSWWRWAL